jgi:hypothetical protein
VILLVHVGHDGMMVSLALDDCAGTMHHIG